MPTFSTCFYREGASVPLLNACENAPIQIKKHCGICNRAFPLGIGVFQPQSKPATEWRSFRGSFLHESHLHSPCPLINLARVGCWVILVMLLVIHWKLCLCLDACAILLVCNCLENSAYQKTKDRERFLAAYSSISFHTRQIHEFASINRTAAAVCLSYITSTWKKWSKSVLLFWFWNLAWRSSVSQTYLEAILTAKIKGRKQKEKQVSNILCIIFMRSCDLVCSTQTLALHFTHALLCLVFLHVPPETPVH